MLHSEGFQLLLRDLSWEWYNFSDQSSLESKLAMVGWIMSLLACCNRSRCWDIIWKRWQLKLVVLGKYNINVFIYECISLIQRPLFVAEVSSSHKRMYDGNCFLGSVPSFPCLSCPLQFSRNQYRSYSSMCSL